MSGLTAAERLQQRVGGAGGPVPADGAGVLDDVRAFLVRFVVYPAPWCADAHALWIAHSWLMDAWESTPRIAFLSPEPGSGKSRALEVTEPLVPRPVHAVNTTPAYLFRKVSDEAGTPTILYDEIDTVFGPKAKDNEDIRGMLNAGHRKGAVAGRATKRGQVIVTEELPAYCAVALAGLNDLPDTIMTRAVVVRMRRRAPSEVVEPWRLRVNGAEAHVLHERLARWAANVAPLAGSSWPDMPEVVQDRNADVWEALLAVADLAGGHWPERARYAAVTAVTEAGEAARESLGIRLLRDLRDVFAGRPSMRTEDILQALNDLEDAPWGDLRGAALDARGLARRLAKYGVKRQVLRVEGYAQTVRGYSAADLADPWSRYLPPPSPSPEMGNNGNNGNQSAPGAPAVTPVTDVTDLVGQTRETICAICGEPLTFDDGTGTHATCEVVS